MSVLLLLTVCCVQAAQIQRTEFHCIMRPYGVRMCEEMCSRIYQCSASMYVMRDLSCSLPATKGRGQQEIVASHLLQSKTKGEVSRKKIMKCVCPGRFVLYRESCYHFTNKLVAWLTAASMCHQLGADLVKVDDREEDDFIVSQLKNLSFVKGMDGYWTGGHYMERKWIWRDGTVVQYTRWAKGEPDTEIYQRYLAYIHPKRWFPDFQWASHRAWEDGNEMHGCGVICEKAVTN